MRNLFLILAGVAMMAGASLASAPAMAQPGAQPGNYAQSVQYRHHHQHRRPGYHHRRHHRPVCRTVIRKKVVWRHHRRHVVRYRTRVCNWR